MEAFFLSVAELDHVDLRGKPIVVSGSKKKDVILAAQ